METKSIKSALVSVFYKDGLEDIVRALDAKGVTGEMQVFVTVLDGQAPVFTKVERLDFVS